MAQNLGRDGSEGVSPYLDCLGEINVYICDKFRCIFELLDGRDLEGFGGIWPEMALFGRTGAPEMAEKGLVRTQGFWPFSGDFDRSFKI